MDYVSIDLVYNWYFMSRFWERASVGLGNKYFNVTRSWFIVLFFGTRWWWSWIIFVEWLTNERNLALNPSGITVRDSNYHKSPTRCSESEFRFCWIKMYGISNHYSLHRLTPRVWVLWMESFLESDSKFRLKLSHQNIKSTTTSKLFG